MERTDVLILGGGIAGLATAWSLAQRGVRGIVLAEREPELGTQSSGKSAAILLTAVEDGALGELARAGARFLTAPPAGFAPRPLVDPVGVLLVAAERHRAELDRLAPHLPREGRAVDGREARALAPFWSGEIARGLFAPGEGRIDAPLLLESFARGARELGVEIRTGAAASELRVEDGAVRGARFAGGREIAAATTVLAAGAWAGALAARAGSQLELRPTSRHLLVTQADGRIDPRWPIVWQLGEEFYARPESGGWLACAC